MRAPEKALKELHTPAFKRTLGGHGDFSGFGILLATVDDEEDLYTVELPQQIKCSTCKFLVPEFHQSMPCWDCVLSADLPKWRPRSTGR